MKPLISYVLTTFNCEKYIKEAVESAFSQSYSPLEIILSDDCSTDKTYIIMENMVKNYKGPHKIILNRNSSNLGITRHMNKAYLELANGNIIIAAHGDDISFPSRTIRSYNFFKNNPNFTAVSFGLIIIDDKGKEDFFISKTKQVKKATSYELKHSCTYIPNIPAPSRAFYKSNMTFFGPLQDFCPTEDELISLRSLLLGKIAFLPEKLVKYRKHIDNMSSFKNFYKFSLFDIYRQQILDLNYAVNKKIISKAKAIELKKILFKGIKKRQLYRDFLTKKTFKSLILYSIGNKHNLLTMIKIYIKIFF